MPLALVACAAGPPRSAVVRAPTLSEPAGESVHVTFYARGAEPWSLRDGTGAFVCRLPCAAWVPPNAGLTLALDDKLVDGEPVTFPVPPHLPALTGDDLVVTVDRTHAGGTVGKIIAAPTAAVFGLAGLAFTGISIASLASGSKNTTTSTGLCASVGTSTGPAGGKAESCTREESQGVAAGVGGLAIGIGALAIATAATYWFFRARAGGLRYDERTPPASATSRVGPRGIELGAARVVMGPEGIMVSF